MAGGSRPKVGVVLSSGGIKPASSVALFEFLDKENITIDLLVGCSGGGGACALYAAGYDSDGITEKFRETAVASKAFKSDYRTLLNIAHAPYGHFDISRGLVHKQKPFQLCENNFGDLRLENLRPKTILQATNIQTGHGVILTEGLAAETVYATSAFYPIVPPIKINGQWLVDGVYSSPLPVIEAVKREMDVIIAMMFHEDVNPEPKQFTEAFNNITRSFSLSLIKSQLAMSIDLHHHEIIFINVPFKKSISLGDASQLPAIVEAGHKSVERHANEILEAVNNFENETQASNR